jgi:histone deacetylase 11
MYFHALFALLGLLLTAPAAAKQPIVYSPGYNVNFYGIHHVHPFDMHKYGKIHAKLCYKFDWSADDFYTPEPISRELLLTVHTPYYLDEMLKNQETLAYIIQESSYPVFLNKILLSLIKQFSIETLEKNLLMPAKLASGGTVLATELAYESGTWAINLGGGYHHAEPEHGDGFCVYADAAIAIKQLWLKDPNLKVMYIDLDAHQGNGVELCLADELKKENPRLIVFDVYSGNDYPMDLGTFADVNKRAYDIREYIQYNYPLFVDTVHDVYNKPNPVGDELYLPIIRNDLKRAIETEKPDFIFYNAGTDPYHKDILGKLGLSYKGILERDYLVWKYARDNNIPLVMTLSGGYTRPKLDGVQLISNSIAHCLWWVWQVQPRKLDPKNFDYVDYVNMPDYVQRSLQQG